MKPFKIEIGDRYGDDSGWERRVAVDMQAGLFEIDFGGTHLTRVDIANLPWLLEALGKAYDLAMREQK